VLGTMLRGNDIVTLLWDSVIWDCARLLDTEPVAKKSP
jgi:hypothetical protein